MVNTIIFSKDRACQLELLLRSIKKFFKGWENNLPQVLYTYTDKDLKKGYEKLKQMHPEYKYICEKDTSNTFKQKVIEMINLSNPHTMFLVDDDVFKENFTLKSKEFNIFKNSKDILCLSLRMHPKITFSYTQNVKITPPKLDKNNVWNWKESRKISNWGYPMSLDGHIFRTNEILPIIKKIKFNNPNTFESSLSKNPINKPKMICYPNSKIVNIPCNKAQDAYKNRYGDITIKFLNNSFLKNQIISLENIIKLKNNSPHQEVNLELIKN